MDILFKEDLFMALHNNPVDGRYEKVHGNRDMKLQDVFLNHCRREKVAITMQLLDQSVKQGQIIGFDSQSIILEEEGRQHLIYKTAIVAINPKQQVNYIFNESYRNDPLKGYTEYAADFA
jgi:host factor-I protein